MMELDPHYCDVIINRFVNFSGKKAYRQEADGSLTDYDEIIAE